MAEWRLYEEGTVPEWTTPEWYAGRERAPHLEEMPHIPRLMKTADYVCLAGDYGAKELVDLGAGDGGLLSLMKTARPDMPQVGFDLQQSNVDGAVERGVDVRLHDVVAVPIVWAGGPAVAVCTEFLEHLLDPHAFVAQLPFEWVVASSPAFESDKSHYAFHTWAWDGTGYADMFLNAGFDVLKHELVGEFQVLLAAAP